MNIKWKKTGSIVDRILKNSKRPIKDELEKEWAKMDEGKMADIETFENNELVLKVNNSAYLQTISFKRKEIMRILSEKLGLKIRSIKIKLGGR